MDLLQEGVVGLLDGWYRNEKLMIKNDNCTEKFRSHSSLAS